MWVDRDAIDVSEEAQKSLTMNGNTKRLKVGINESVNPIGWIG